VLSTHNTSFSDFAILGVFSLWMGAMFWLGVAVPFLAADASGLTVRNPVGVCHLEWEEVAETIPGQYGLNFRLPSGEYVRARAIQKSGMNISRRQRTYADAVGDWLREIASMDQAHREAALKAGPPRAARGSLAVVAHR
jgi:hypothetical protein